MNFNLNQLLQNGPVRELILNQVGKQFGVTNETGGSLLTKGLSLILGGMSQKASNTQGANDLFNLIRNTNLQSNPLDIVMGKTDIATNNNNLSNLFELGKNILPNLFGDRTDVVASHLATSTNTNPTISKGMLGLLLPIVFSFFKDKISSGFGLNNFTNLLAEQTRAVSNELDTGALAALGFANKSFSDVLSNVAKVGTVSIAATAHTATAKPASTTTTVKTEPAKSSSLSKWLIGAGIILAALFGIKSCSDKGTTTTANAPAAQTTPAAQVPATETVKVSDGLGNLAWEKTDKDLTVSGTVQNDGIKASILDAFKGLAAGLPLVDKLTVDATADKFSFNNFSGLADLFKEFPGVNGAFADKVLNLVGEVNSEDAKTSLVEKAKALLGSLFTVNADKVNVNEPEAEVLADMSLSKLDLDIMFATASSEINPRYFRRLNALAQYFVENKRTGEISGYTDNVGDAAANQQLSEQRAKSVRDYLIKQGVPAESLTAVGYGQDNPVADNSTEEGRKRNRRIEFNVR
ncbi:MULTISPECIES: OmpA family protein [unclassified Mannheimia]|uniref:OmpA family protein n=1 Tax=unclassified Mannheimia TaxID=2645054 RepID=UPI00359E5DF9